MRIKKLILHAFGHFTDKQFDFGARPSGASDFHIFYGRNEAGKTTIMEAWLRLLFGIPAGKGETYGFKHGRRNLKIGACLELDGKEIYLARAPAGHYSVLQDEAGRTLPEESLSRALPGFNEAKYRNYLCLDDAVIEQGGDNILQSRGELGETLFTAASGLTRFSAQLTELEDKAAALYKPRSHETKLGQLKANYEELGEKAERITVSAARYEELKNAAVRFRQAEEQLQTERRAALDKLNLLRELAEIKRQIAEHQQKFTDAAAELAEAAERLGFTEAHFTEAEAEACYQRLKPYALSPAARQSFRDLSEKLAAKKQAAERLSSQYAAERAQLEDKQAECAQLQAALPAQDTQGSAISAVLEEFRAAETAQAYRSVTEQQRAAAERFAKALQKLAVKGQIFKDIPYAPLSAREAEAKIRDKTDALNKAALYKENLCRTEAELRAAETALGRLYRRADSAGVNAAGSENLAPPSPFAAEKPAAERTVHDL